MSSSFSEKVLNKCFPLGKAWCLFLLHGIILLEMSALNYNAAIGPFTWFFGCFFFLLTLYRPFWGVWFFVAMVPFLSGLSIVKGCAGTSLFFNFVYLAWFPRYFFKKKNSQVETITSRLNLLLTVVVLLNVFLAVGRLVEWPMPSRYWLEWASSFPFYNQAEPLWQVSAALILLKGLVLFQMVEHGLTDPGRWRCFSRVIYVQAICIVAFSLFQLITYKGDKSGFSGLQMPFNDIHSYGSVVVLLFVVFVVVFLHIAKAYRGRIGECGGDDGNRWLKFCLVVNGLLAAIFFCFCFYSSSRMTWLAMGLMLFLVFVKTVRTKRHIFTGIAFLVVIYSVATLFAPALLQSNKYYVHKIGTMLTITEFPRNRNVIARVNLWERSLRMLKSSPLIGVGIGNVYRNIRFFKGRSKRLLDSENSHNYYLQIAAELGFPGIVIFIFLLLSVCCVPRRGPPRGNEIPAGEIPVTVFRYGLGAYLLTMLTGHPLLLPCQQFIFWPVVAVISRGLHLFGYVRAKDDGKRNMVVGLAIVGLLFYFVGFGLNMQKFTPWTMPVTYGFYAEENWAGKPMRWMSGTAEYSLPADREKLILRVVALPFNSGGPEGLTLTVRVNDRVVDRVHFIEGGSRLLFYDLSSVKGRKKVDFWVDRVFRPRDIGLSKDTRLLGVAIGELEKMPALPALPLLLFK